jgi:hypothetical protein
VDVSGRAVAAEVGGGAVEEVGPQLGGDQSRLVQDGDGLLHGPVEDQPPQLGRDLGVPVEEGEDRVVLREGVGVLGRGGVGDRALALAPVEVAVPVEVAEAFGGEQQRIGDGDVLVVAASEADVQAQQEVAADDLVPDREDHLQQAGPLGEGEHLGDPVEQPAPGVGLGAAVGVGAGEAGDQHVRAEGGEPLGDGVDRALGQPVVAVDEPHVVAGRLGQSGLAGPSEAAVLREVQDGQPGVASGVGVQHDAAAVGRAVVHGDDLQPYLLGDVDGEDRVQAARQVVGDAVHRQDEAEADIIHKARAYWSGREHPIPLRGRGRSPALGRGRRGQVGVDVEQPADAQRREDLVHMGALLLAGRRQDQPQLARAGAQQPPGADQHAHPAGVAEAHPAEVQHDAPPALGDEAVHLRPNLTA